MPAAIPGSGAPPAGYQKPRPQAQGKQPGPDGANLFVYHVPLEFGDDDLHKLFQPYGRVVSAKIFVDKNTNLSRGFGFVSFDNPDSAAMAIQALNGSQCKDKWLKVELKKPPREKHRTMQGNPY